MQLLQFQRYIGVPPFPLTLIGFTPMLLHDNSSVKIKYSYFAAVLGTQIDSVQEALILSQIWLEPLEGWVCRRSAKYFGEQRVH